MAPERGGTTLVIDQRGKETDLAKFYPEDGGQIEFYSNVARQIGMTELTIRHCDVYERLFDLKIKFLVKQNSQPVFVNRLKNQFTVKVNENQAYELPEIVDP